MSLLVYAGTFPAPFPATELFTFNNLAAETCPECNGEIYAPFMGVDGGAFPCFCTEGCVNCGESDLVLADRYSSGLPSRIEDVIRP